MHSVLSQNCVSVTELKRNYTQVLLQANNQAVAVLNHNRPEAYLLPAAMYEKLLDQLEDAQLVPARAASPLIGVRIQPGNDGLALDERLALASQTLTALESGQINVIKESTDWVSADMTTDDDADFNAEVFEQECALAQSALAHSALGSA
jgi:antitoxin StbD